MSTERTVPRATYRLQLGPDQRFEDVARRAPYFARLGVSHVYLSPVLQATPGSTHGYDVVDPGHVSDVLGGADGFEAMVSALRHAGLGVVLDIVPNHMSIASPRANPWWWDVLENGVASAYANWFDVDWRTDAAPPGDRVRVPILGDHYGRVLESGAIRVEREGSEFAVRVYDELLPAAPISLAPVLGAAAQRCGSDELGFIADALAQLPHPSESDAGSRRRRHRDKAVLGRLIGRILHSEPEIARAVDDELARTNRSHEALHALLEQQNYRLLYWRASSHDLDYRRFFDINSLAGLRVEAREVFDATHALALGWVRSGHVDGLRVDHVDGLRDPQQYLERLREAAPQAWIVVEKILEADEPLPRDWPVHGTTGYEFMARLGGLFVDPAGAVPLTALWTEYSGEETHAFADLARHKKRSILRDILGADLMRLARGAQAVCEDQLEHRDYTRQQLRDALEELLVQLPVYRTYGVAGHLPSERDRALLTELGAAAKAARGDLEPALFDFLTGLLSGPAQREAEAELRAHFQQLSGAAMAKGLEDTAFYCFHRLVCLNEVGSDPGHFGTSIAQLHEHCHTQQARWPETMTATSTHDTKRSEDVRVRIAAISEVPERWAEAVHGWSQANDRYREREGAPDSSAEYLLYQTLVGAWPIATERVCAYMLKAAREAKQTTSWLSPDSEYESALERFCTAVCQDTAFTTSLCAFAEPLWTAARTYSLAQALIKLTAPGVPDLYQGCEGLQYQLTDPDNRTPVDFEQHERWLSELEALSPGQILEHPDASLAKLWVTQRALQLRAARPECFGARGDYTPIPTAGEHAECAFAFARKGEIAIVAPRRLIALGGSWKDTEIRLPEGSWRHVLVPGVSLPSGSVRLSELLAPFPVALLERRPA